MHEAPDIAPFSTRLPQWLSPVNFAWFGTFAAVVSLSWSEAVQNIAMGFILAGALLHLLLQPRSTWITDPAKWKYGLLLTGIFGLSLLAGIYTDDGAAWSRDLRQKLPFLLLGLAFGILPSFSAKQLYVIVFAFLLVQATIALFSLIAFFQHYEMGMGRIARNANIPIIVKISHIYFGLLMAGSVILGLGCWLQRIFYSFAWERHILLSLTVINFLCLHLLSSRTGLVAMYGGLGVGIILYVIRTRAWRAGGLILLILLSIPGISYYTIPTFQTRIHATLWDIQGYQHSDRDLAHHSASLRLLAWEAALHIFLDHPLLGTGIGDLESAMKVEYQQMEMRTSLEQLPQTPHNQYLEYLAGFGLTGEILLLMVCLSPMLANEKKISYVFISFVGMYMTAMLFESLLERQIGMYFFIIFIMLLPSIPYQPLFHKAFSQT